MATNNLGKLFKPQSIAVIGASNREGSVGAVTMRNLLEGGFSGPIMPVNPGRQSVAGVLTYPSVDKLSLTPDLAVICTPPQTVPDLVAALAARKVPAAVIMTAGLEHAVLDDGRTIADVVAQTAGESGLRILGHNCLGLLVPGIGLNASFAHLPAKAGNIAFVSQSGAMCTAVLDWAATRDIGFSHFISLGNSLNVGFGDVIDYLGSDPSTRAILLYIESICDRRNFMSAARASARNKPVLVIKSGRSDEGAVAANSHTGALAGSDDVYDAAIRRAGMLRVDTIDELFAAVETLAHVDKPTGERLGTVTNGGGIGVMAVDALSERGGRMAELPADLITEMDSHLPDTWSRGNPVDIIGDAPGERYAQATRMLLESKAVDAVLVMHAPTATADSMEAALAVIDAGKGIKKPLLTSWVGGKAVGPARQAFAEAGVATYDTPSQAVTAFMQLIDYQRNQTMLMETPASLPVEFTPATATARLIIEGVLAGGEERVNEAEAKAVLAAYGIPTVETHVAGSPPEAAAKADEIGYPVALKILSPDVVHKSDAGGVVLYLNAAAVRTAAEKMLVDVHSVHPNAAIQGFSVQAMARRPGAYELIIGVKTDPIFGPVILFGRGGTAVEVIRDRAVGMPPLNMLLAREIIERTQVYKLLKGYRDRPAIDFDALCLTLVQISQMVVDIPEIAELDINPLFTDHEGVLAVDARIQLRHHTESPGQRLAIRPYPKQYEETFTLKETGQAVLLRPIRPEDEQRHYAFIDRLTPEDIRFRFFGLVNELPHNQMARLTQIDYDREMAFIATTENAAGEPETMGVVRTVTDPDNETAEFAIVVRSDIKGQGLGYKLLDKMIAYCRSRGTGSVVGQVLADNRRMLRMVKEKGFAKHRLKDEPVVEVTLDLRNDFHNV